MKTAEDVHNASRGGQEIHLGIVDNLVIIEFQYPTKWIAVDKKLAKQIAANLILLADKIITD
jgi:hypothetical protein